MQKIITDLQTAVVVVVKWLQLEVTAELDTAVVVLLLVMD